MIKMAFKSVRDIFTENKSSDLNQTNFHPWLLIIYYFAYQFNLNLFSPTSKW